MEHCKVKRFAKAAGAQLGWIDMLSKMERSDIAVRKKYMQDLCVNMLHRIDSLNISATTDGGFVSECDGVFMDIPINHLRCLLRVDFRDENHGLNSRDFKEVVEKTISSLLEVVKEEGKNPSSSLIRAVVVE